jgi:hypothetical protein
VTQFPTEVPLDDMEATVSTWRHAVEQAGRWKAKADIAQARIIERLGQPGDVVGTIRGSIVVRCIVDHRLRFDTLRFKDEYPQLAEDFAYRTIAHKLRLARHPKEDSALVASGRDAT